MKEEKVFFRNSKGQKLCGLLSLPDVEKPPIIIFVHGFKMNKEAHLMVNNSIKPLLDDGIAVLRIDCRGSGESDLEFHEFTITSEGEDINTAIDYAKTLNIDSERIGVVGISLGATAILSANPDVKTIVFWGPAWKSTRYDTPENRKRIKEEKVFNAIHSLSGKKFVAGKDLFYEMLNFDYVLKCKNLKKVPTLILRGEVDEIVTDLSHDKIVTELLNAKYVVIPKGDHNFTNKSAEKELIKETIKWFNKWLK